MGTAPPPPITLDLTWQGGFRFAGRAGDTGLVLDGARQAGLSPVQALAFGLAGCMAIDVVDILTKGRFSLDGLHVRCVAERRAEVPRRLEKVELHFDCEGDVPPDRIERAIALSRERYCSVWHSLRPDIEFRTSFAVAKTVAAPGVPSTESA